MSMEDLRQMYAFDPPLEGLEDGYKTARLREETEYLKDLISEDYYWDLSSPECLRYKLATEGIKSTSPDTTIFRPKNSFKELPSRHIAEDTDPSAMTERVSVDISDYIFLKPRKFEYDRMHSVIRFRTRLDAEADATITEVISYLAKLKNQSLTRYKEFGFAIPGESVLNHSAIKGARKLYEFAYFQNTNKEFRVNLKFLPVWDQHLVANTQPSVETIVLVIGLGDVIEQAHLIDPAFGVHDEIEMTVDLSATVGQIISHCLTELSHLTHGRITLSSASRFGFQLGENLFANDSQLLLLPILTNEQDEGENYARLVLITDSSVAYQPPKPTRKVKAKTATVRVDVSEVASLLGDLQLSNLHQKEANELITTISCKVAHITVNTSLLSTPSWLLREILAIASMVYGFPPSPQYPGTTLILKGSEEEQYLNEDHQLQHYDLVRNTIAEDRLLTLKLVERKLGYECPALNFHYIGSVPVVAPIEDRSEELREGETLRNDSSFKLTIKRFENVQALFKNLNQVLPDYLRTSRAKTCTGRIKSGKNTPRYLSPDVIYQVDTGLVNDIDMTNDSNEQFASHATELLNKSGVQMPITPNISVELRFIAGEKEQCFLRGPTEINLRNSIPVDIEFTLDKMPLRSLPDETRIGIEVKCGEKVLACVSFSLFEQIDDEHVQPRFGELTLRMWPLHCLCNDYVTMLDFSGINPKKAIGRELYTTVTINIPHSEWRQRNTPIHSSAGMDVNLFNLKQLADFLDYSPIKLEEADINKQVIYEFRHFYKLLDIKLAYFLKSVMWTDPAARDEALKTVTQWTTLNPEDAVCLLGCQFSDARIRAHIVSLLDKMEDNDLVNYIPQLAQALFFELRHSSALERFLLKRALQDPYEVGHQLFWCLRSQYMILPYRERLLLLIEKFAMNCGNYRKVLATELRVVETIYKRVGLLKDRKITVEERKHEAEVLQDELRNSLPEEFTIPTSTTRLLQREGLECEIMDSKLRPVKLKFRVKGCPGKTYHTMFKIGDDLRQDMLILQIFRILQKTWRDSRLPVRMKTYRVVAIDQRSGLIEIVPQSFQISKIQLGHGGLLTRKSTWIHNFISQYNGDYKSLKRARENFMISCACYCTATYVLGVGDRHDGNIMIDRDGVLFHIDFGHILGNFKEKWHIRRERYKVKFSEDMHTVLSDSNNYDDFLILSQHLYNSLREKGHRLFYLMKMMSTGGMPELKGYKDLNYLIKRLKMEKSDGQVKDLMKRQVEKSLKSWLRPLDRLIHNIAHGGLHCRCSCYSSSES